MKVPRRFASALLVLGWAATAGSSSHAQPAAPDPTTPTPAPDAPAPPDPVAPVAPAPAPPAPAPPAPAPPAPAAPAALTGTVLLTGKPAALAAVVVEDPTGALHRATTAADGSFRLDAIVPGACTITTLAESGEQDVQAIELVAGATAQLTIRLTADSTSGETIVIRGLTKADERRESADAVTVVETERAKRSSADLGEVLARTKGVSVRKDGGLGSRSRLSLAGLSDEQIRFFIDGVPLEIAGYPFGIANVPVNLVERIEIYNGMVPVRFGADALGGAVNLVTDQSATNSAGASYELGSFGTHRLTLHGRAIHAPTGLYVRAEGFVDRARNDYPIQADVPNPVTGKIVETTVDRFHDAYSANGGGVELGVVDRAWAKRLSVRVVATGFDKEYQSDLGMNRVYGAVTYGEESIGTVLRYQQTFARDVELEAIAGYTFTRGEFRDVSACDYDWYGDCFRQGQPGETDTVPHLQVNWQHAAFARLNAGWKPAPKHALRLALAPTYLTRSGDERLDPTTAEKPVRDPLTAERELTNLIGGVEYQLDALGDRLQNVVFAKAYLQEQASEDPQPGGLDFLRVDRSSSSFGFGDGLRYRVAPWLYAKLSYEWSTRLPRPVEVFGDNVLITPNLSLEPEVSHNVNLGGTVDDLAIPCAGELSGTVTAFLRETEKLIVPLGNNNDLTYQNVFGARSLGVEASAEWTAPGEYVVLDGSVTYQSFRNTSADGQFGSFEGDRIPNQPYFFGNLSARFQLGSLLRARDELSLTVTSRYVGDFFRSWESAGDRETKQVIPSQLSHTAGLGYRLRGERWNFSTNFEVSNFTDADTYDYFRVQRPGRAFYLKTAIEL